MDSSENNDPGNDNYSDLWGFKILRVTLTNKHETKNTASNYETQFWWSGFGKMVLSYWCIKFESYWLYHFYLRSTCMCYICEL